MNKYRLKKDARQFFDEKFHDKISSLEFWEKEIISINLLDEVENVYVEYGIKSSENGTSLKGWGDGYGNPKAQFHFTVNVKDISCKKYDTVKIPELMDEMQKVLNRFFKRFTD